MAETILVPNIQSFMELLYFVNVRKIKHSSEYFEA